MDPGIIVGLLSLIGTLVGTFGGILASSRLTNYRLAQLEEKVNKHNNLIDRTYKLEEELAIQNQRISAAETRLAQQERKQIS
ncbi:MAG: hypothetical protein PUB99_09115 [Oscillospiraceae bacterium]|nr:hypothetical protein [Oscillospiraceae bacterium]